MQAMRAMELLRTRRRGGGGGRFDMFSFRVLYYIFANGICYFFDYCYCLSVCLLLLLQIKCLDY